MMFEEENRSTLPIRSALIWIMLTTIIVSGTLMLSYLYYCYWLEQRMQDESYNIQFIEHHTKDGRQLDTNYLAEILKLSSNQKNNIYQFSIERETERLQTCPVIDDCLIRKKNPSTIRIDYKMRRPIALLSDFSNTLIDREGVIFPHNPYYSGLNVPKVRLGLDVETVEWGEVVTGKNLALAYDILQWFKQHPQIQLKMVDVSKAYAPSYGKREVVVKLQGKSVDQIVRCSTRNYVADLSHYLKMENELAQSGKIVDLRISQLAFYTDINDRK